MMNVTRADAVRQLLAAVFDRVDGRAIQRDQNEVGGQIVFQINTGIIRDGDGALSLVGADPLLIEGHVAIQEGDRCAVAASPRSVVRDNVRDKPEACVET